MSFIVLSEWSEVSWRDINESGNELWSGSQQFYGGDVV